MKKAPSASTTRRPGSGFPLLILPGGGLNATMQVFTSTAPFNAMDEFRDQFRCITPDLRNANGGQSTGPLEIDRPWDAYTDDHLGLMDHLGVNQFMVMGFCIGGPFIWNLLKRAPRPDRRGGAGAAERISSGEPDLFYNNNIEGLGPRLREAGRRHDGQVDAFLNKMYPDQRGLRLHGHARLRASCTTPVLVLPDDVPAHPYAVAMEQAMLAPNAQVSLYPWKEPKERIPLAVRHVRSFLTAHLPVRAPAVNARVA